MRGLNILRAAQSNPISKTFEQTSIHTKFNNRRSENEELVLVRINWRSWFVSKRVLLLLLISDFLVSPMCLLLLVGLAMLLLLSLLLLRCCLLSVSLVHFVVPNFRNWRRMYRESANEPRIAVCHFDIQFPLHILHNSLYFLCFPIFAIRILPHTTHTPHLFECPTVQRARCICGGTYLVCTRAVSLDRIHISSLGLMHFV